MLAFAFSASLPIPFVLVRFTSGYSARLFFLSALFPFSPPAAFRCSRFLSSLWSFPFIPDPFPDRSFRFCILSFLLVSFRSSLLHSRSRSAGAHLSLSLKVFLHDVRFLSSAPVLGFQLLSFLLFPFLFSTVSAIQLGFLSFSGLLSLSCLSSSFQPGFPCFPSDSKYSAFCSFPFVLPCFAPTAVPQVLPFWISPPGSVPDFHFLSSASVLASHYSAFCVSFPFFPFSPHSGLSGASLSVLPFRLFPCFPSDFGTRLSCNSLFRFLFRITGATTSADLSSRFQVTPLSFRLRFWLFWAERYTLKTEH